MQLSYVAEDDNNQIVGYVLAKMWVSRQSFNNKCMTADCINPGKRILGVGKYKITDTLGKCLFCTGHFKFDRQSLLFFRHVVGKW